MVYKLYCLTEEEIKIVEEFGKGEIVKMCDWKSERDRIKERMKDILPKNFKGKMVYKVPTEKIDKKLLEKIKQILDEERIDLNVDKIARSNTIITDVIHMEFIDDLMSEIDNVFEMRYKRGFYRD